MRLVEYDRHPRKAQAALSEIEQELAKLMGTLRRGGPERRPRTKEVVRMDWQESSTLLAAVDKDTSIKSFGSVLESSLRRTKGAAGRRAWEMSQARNRAKLEDHNAWLQDFKHRTIALTR